MVEPMLRLPILLALCSALIAENHGGIESLTLQDMPHGLVTIPVSQNRATVVIFISVICPMSVDYGSRMAKLYDDYSGRGVRVLFIDSNSNEANEDVQQQGKHLGLPHRIYRDPNGA